MMKRGIDIETWALMQKFGVLIVKNEAFLLKFDIDIETKKLILKRGH